MFSYAETVNAQYMETSAKENLGISQVFDRLAEEMIRMAEANPQQSTRTGNSNSANGRSNRYVDHANFWGTGVFWVKKEEGVFKLDLSRDFDSKLE